jgi:hypothetical protein
MRPALVAVFTAMIAVASPSAPADADEHAGPGSSGRRWYGGPIVLADGLALTAIVAGWADRSEALLGAGVASFALVPAVVHTVNGHWGRGLVSVGLRAAVPALAGLVGASLGASGDCHQDDDSCVAHGFTLGALIGLFAVVAADQALAFDPGRTAAPARGVAVMPTLAIGRAGGSLGLGGAF